MEDTPTLAEMLLHAERFCLRVESAVADSTPTPEDEELRLRISVCRNILLELQKAYDEDELRIDNPPVRANFRFLVVTLLWVAFRARHAIDHRTFRMLVMIESSFTYLLITQP